MASSVTIWKFPLPASGAVDMPRGATILCVQTQGGEPMIWALVDATKPIVPRRFSVYGTGHPVPNGKFSGDGVFVEGEVYAGTFQADNLVFHVFERRT